MNSGLWRGTASDKAIGDVVILLSNYNIDLSNIDLRSADMRGADLRGSDPSHADLRNTILSSEYLTNTNLTNADLRGARIEGTETVPIALPSFEMIGGYGLRVTSVDIGSNDMEVELSHETTNERWNLFGTFDLIATVRSIDGRELQHTERKEFEPNQQTKWLIPKEKLFPSEGRFAVEIQAKVLGGGLTGSNDVSIYVYF